MAARCIALSLTLGLTACLFTAATRTRETGAPVTGATTAGSGGDLTSAPATAPGGGEGEGGTANHMMSWKVTTPAGAAPTPSTTPAKVATPARTTATPATTTAIPKATLDMAPKAAAPAMTPASTPMTQPAVRVQPPPDQTATFMVLFLLLLLLAISLYGAWRKLQSYGGSGSYYPGRSDKRLYISPEEAEGEARGPRAWGQAFVAAVRNLLSWKPDSEEEEEEEEEREEEERAEQTPGDGESEREAEEEEDGAEAHEDKDEEMGQSDSDDYSSLGGLDLRAREVMAGGEEEDFPDPSSPSSDELLSDLHSFSGTASWTDTNHDVTAL